MQTDQNQIVDMLNQAESLLGQNNYQQAAALYSKITQLDPENAEAFLMLGSILGEVGQLQEADRLLARATELAPMDGHAHFVHGHVCRARGDVEAAITAFRKTSELDPEDTEALATLGALLHEQQRLDEAVDCFERAVRCQDADANMWVMLGSLKYARGELAEAATAYRRAREMKPGGLDPFLGLARALVDLGEYEEAENLLAEALRVHDNDARLCDLMSLAKYGRGHIAEALEYNERALALEPETDTYIIRRADLLERSGDIDTAFDTIRPLLEVEDVAVDAALTFARLCPALGMQEEGRLLLDKVSSGELSEKQKRAIEDMLTVLQ